MIFNKKIHICGILKDIKLPEKFVKELYDEVPISIKFSLIRLLQNSTFKNNDNILRKEEWFDWQILSAVKMIILTYRNRIFTSSNLSVQQMFEEIKRQSIEGEKENDIVVSLEKFSLKNLRNTLILAKKELKKRYEFDRMDVKHDDFFDLDKITNL